MTTDTIVRPGARLPDIALPSTPDGAPVSLRIRSRDGRVVVLLHSADCEGCIAYLDSLAGAHEMLRDWDGRVMAVVPADLPAAERLREARGYPFAVLADPAERVATKCGVGGGSILIADQWGELFLVQPGEAERHDFPSTAEVAEWLRFMAIQCPECQGEAK